MTSYPRSCPIVVIAAAPSGIESWRKPSVFEKMYYHVLTDKGLEIFDQDYAAIKK